MASAGNGDQALAGGLATRRRPRINGWFYLLYFLIPASQHHITYFTGPSYRRDGRNFDLTDSYSYYGSNEIYLLKALGSYAAEFNILASYLLLAAGLLATLVVCGSRPLAQRGAALCVVWGSLGIGIWRFLISNESWNIVGWQVLSVPVAATLWWLLTALTRRSDPWTGAPAKPQRQLSRITQTLCLLSPCLIVMALVVWRYAVVEQAYRYYDSRNMYCLYATAAIALAWLLPWAARQLNLPELVWRPLFCLAQGWLLAVAVMHCVAPGANALRGVLRFYADSTSYRQQSLLQAILPLTNWWHPFAQMMLVNAAVIAVFVASRRLQHEHEIAAGVGRT